MKNGDNIGISYRRNWGLFWNLKFYLPNEPWFSQQHNFQLMENLVCKYKKIIW